jgi:ribonuclease BN (tRNA processing enzyme)
MLMTGFWCPADPKMSDKEKKRWWDKGEEMLFRALPQLPKYIEFKDGRTLAISGDTDYCRNLVELASEVDLLVLECSFPDEKKVEGHLIPSLVGRIGLESRCKKLLLTHFYPICDSEHV